MKNFILVSTIFLISFKGVSQKFEFDFLSSSLDETILKDHQYIKSHFLGTDVARKVKLVDLAYNGKILQHLLEAHHLLK